jgi:polysaccharide biosynthesis protein PslG
MTHRPGLLLVALLALLAAAAPATAGAASRDGLRTGVQDPRERAFADPDGDRAHAVAKAAGMTIDRLPLRWNGVAPSAPKSPADPADPAYNWVNVDDRVRRIVEAGLEPLIVIDSPPLWARREKGKLTPNASDFGAFVTAAARRYPNVRLWQMWNEPNLKTYLDPANVATRYRELLQAAYPALKRENAANVVIAGGTGPFAGDKGRFGIGPLRFMREVLAEETPFDAWAHHPYTSGGPTHRAFARDDASLGDLPAMRRILRRTGHGDKRFFVTEFSWDTAPPDPYGVPLREHARWVSEALYRMWLNGVSVVVWFQLRDNPKGSFTWGQTYQSGLYFRTTTSYAEEKAKPALRAMRFPFVALPAGSRLTLWGRTPGNSAADVVVERRKGGRWRRVKTLKADGHGIFRGRVARSGSAPLRARAQRDRSLPFVPRRTRDRLVNPFGGARLP